MDRDGNYRRSRKSLKLKQFEQDQTRELKKQRVGEQLEMKLQREVVEISSLEDSLQLCLFGKTVGGKMITNSKGKSDTSEQRKKRKKKVRDLYENQNFLDESEKTEKYEMQRKKYPQAQDYYNEIMALLKNEDLPEDTREVIDKNSLIVASLSKQKEAAVVEKSLFKVVHKKIELSKELRTVIVKESKGED